MFGAVLAFAAAPASASSFTVTAEEAALELCPGLRSGRISPDDLTELERRGYRRDPQAEAALAQADPESGTPLIFWTGSPSALVAIAYWPRVEYCNISIKGPGASAAMTAIHARIRAESSGFRWHASHGTPADPWRAEAYVADGAGPQTLVELRWPGAADQSQTYMVSYSTTR